MELLKPVEKQHCNYQGEVQSETYNEKSLVSYFEDNSEIRLADTHSELIFREKKKALIFTS